MDYSELHRRENEGGVNQTVLSFLCSLTLPQALDTITEFIRTSNVQVHVAEENWHTAYLGFQLDTIGVNGQPRVKVAHEPIEVAEDVLVHEFAPPSPASVEEAPVPTISDMVEEDNVQSPESVVQHTTPETIAQDSASENGDYEPAGPPQRKRRLIVASTQTAKPEARAVTYTGVFPRALSSALVDVDRVCRVMSELSATFDVAEYTQQQLPSSLVLLSAATISSGRNAIEALVGPHPPSIKALNMQAKLYTNVYILYNALLTNGQEQEAQELLVNQLINICVTQDTWETFVLRGAPRLFEMMKISPYALLLPQVFSITRLARGSMMAWNFGEILPPPSQHHPYIHSSNSL
ncbi:hypothetical protein BX666DRAFT_1882467 [Dichotomocladium elegans]|nr:hypothetical protein BX666DRAFT_1882467 [Dichotomocladium elegans]